MNNSASLRCGVLCAGVLCNNNVVTFWPFFWLFHAKKRCTIRKIGYFSRNSGNEPVKFHGNFAVEKTDNDMIIENIQSPADVKRLSVEEMKEMAAENRH